MRIENLEVEEKDNRIHVFVQIPHSDKAEGIRKILCKTSDILTILTERGVEVGDCVSSTELKNWRDHTRRGTWVFEKKVEKVLDPEPEPTTIEEEKPVRTRKRRTRSSTKKVSTEE